MNKECCRRCIKQYLKGRYISVFGNMKEAVLLNHEKQFDLWFNELWAKGYLMAPCFNYIGDKDRESYDHEMIPYYPLDLVYFYVLIPKPLENCPYVLEHTVTSVKSCLAME